jgi:hypothetical protein
LIWDEQAGGFASLEEIREGAALRARVVRMHEAMDSGPTSEALRKLPVGAEVEIVGVRTGRPRGSRYEFGIRGGIVQLEGSLRGAKLHEILRVTIRVGPRRWLGLLGPIHAILAWRPADPTS